uniref:Uncharacterized protein n=1 Tax=Anguilla anguilla TaxID=7936 RepID=A0A0E9S987_ANGAN
MCHNSYRGAQPLRPIVLPHLPRCGKRKTRK